ncbi:serine/threonine protein kinase [Bradymonas sediminis]|uniref:Uncharacterized protein n=2 Tax=Bradymonas sediminis TaxID=1548548 RepID=A0A2Z4FJL7_9DELT|nr:hypothetical protein DN745_05960 [Bradymonas sediminis]TDP71913.1 serine/threonine protein kinase [Bradymonas sediminis]
MQWLWHHGLARFLENEGKMAEESGKCPSCDEVGVVGAACGGVACRKRGYHFIPQDFWARAHQGDGQPSPLIGLFIGDFLLVDTVGAGGFGRVCLGLQTPLFRLRGALKLIEFPNDDPNFQRVLLEKFQGEAEVLAGLSHPNIVRLIKYGIHENRPYLVMEYLENGLTLRDEMLRRARLNRGFNRDDLRLIFGQMLNGLAAAHAQQIIHRDLKPENIMLQRVVGNPAHLRILDFGIAKFVEGQTDTKWPLGSPSYMAPEQVSLQNLGTWTDLYAVGVMFFEMVTGRRPFPGDSDEAIMSKKLKGDFDIFEQVADLNLPEEAVVFMRRAMSRDPAARQQTIAEFRRELNVALEALTRDAEVIGPQGREMTFLLQSKDVVHFDDLAEDGGSAHEAPTRAADCATGRQEAPASRAQTDHSRPGRRWIGAGLLGVILLVGAVLAGDSLRGFFGDSGPAPAQDEVARQAGEGVAEATPMKPDAGQDIERPDVVAAPDTYARDDAAALAESIASRISLRGGDVAASIAVFEALPKLPAWAITQISAGKFHTCALRVDGGFRCWGANQYGELGAGNTQAIGDDEPADAIDVLTFDAPATQILAVGDHRASFSCALLKDGSVRCWGNNTHGQLGYGHTRTLGDDETIDGLGPIEIGGVATQIVGGASEFGSHVCALLKDQTMRCWGNGKFGKLGLGHTNTIGDDELPTSAATVSVGAKIAAIAAGKYNTCAILEDRSLRCWGWNAHGQLGLGHTRDIGDNEVPSSVDPIELGAAVMQVAVGRRHLCALLEGGAVRCWGWNNRGQLGLGNTADLGGDELPMTVDPVALGGPAIQVVTGELHSCALILEEDAEDIDETILARNAQGWRPAGGVTAGGKVQCWGDNKFGQLGYGHKRSVGDENSPRSAGTVYLGEPAVALSAGNYHTCALLADGNMRCWGYNDQGQLGYGHVNLIGDNETPASVGNVPVGALK